MSAETEQVQSIISGDFENRSISECGLRAKVFMTDRTLSITSGGCTSIDWTMVSINGNDQSATGTDRRTLSISGDDFAPDQSRLGDDWIGRRVYLNGFAPGSIMEADFIDYFGLLFDGHVRGAWIDRKFGTHATIEFEDEQWAKRALERKKHFIGENRLIVFGWKATKGAFSKRRKKREQMEKSMKSDRSLIHHQLSAERLSIEQQMADQLSDISSLSADIAISKETSTEQASLNDELSADRHLSIGNGSVNSYISIDKSSADRTRNLNKSRPEPKFSMHDLHNKLAISREESKRRRQLAEDLEKRILDSGIWPSDTKLLLFGSSINGFGWCSSDIDLTLLIDFDGFAESVGTVNGSINDSLCERSMTEERCDQNGVRVFNQHLHHCGQNGGSSAMAGGFDYQPSNNVDQLGRNLELLIDTDQNSEFSTAADVHDRNGASLIGDRYPELSTNQIGDQSLMSEDQNRLTIAEYRLLDSRAKLELLASCLREIDSSLISDIVQIHGRRCPVVRFSYRSRSMDVWNRCEISIDNHDVVRKTAWLQWVNRDQEWLPVLYSTFRWWTGQWKELEKIKKEMNGYSIALMVIAYCQGRGLISKEYEKVKALQLHPFADIAANGDHSSSQLDDDILSEIFHEFLSTIHEIRWKQTVFTPALKTADQSIMPLVDFLKSDKYSDRFQFSCTNVQDPFDHGHNTVNHVTEEAVKRLAMVAAYWTRAVCRKGKDQIWKSMADRDANMEIGNETGPVFVCEPSAETLLAILAASGDRVEERWCDIATEAVLDMLSEVLKLRVAEEEPGSKKYYCLAWHATWLMDRRRLLWKKLEEGGVNSVGGVGVMSRYELEKRISELMIEEEDGKATTKKKKRRKIEPVAEFSLFLNTVAEGAFQEVTGRLEGVKHVSIFRKFLNEFVPLVFEDGVRKIMCMKECHV